MSHNRITTQGRRGLTVERNGPPLHAPRRAPAAAVSDTTLAFVVRTTAKSGVPVFVEDQAAIEQIARVLS